MERSAPDFAVALELPSLPEPPLLPLPPELPLLPELPELAELAVPLDFLELVDSPEPEPESPESLFLLSEELFEADEADEELPAFL